MRAFPTVRGQDERQRPLAGVFTVANETRNSAATRDLTMPSITWRLTMRSDRAEVEAVYSLEIFIWNESLTKMNGGQVKERLAQGLAGRLEELGLRFAENVDLARLNEHEPVVVTVVHAQGEAPRQLVYAPAMTDVSLRAARMRQFLSRKLLLIGPRVTERSAEMFRAQGIDYLDQSGNAFIAFNGVHIDVRGRKPNPTTSTALAGPRGSLFSMKRSQVIFALLSWDDLLRKRVRDIADAAGVSLGQVQATMGLLEQGGFLDGRRWASPGERDRLIDQWTAAYPLGLGAAAMAQPFSGDFTDLHATSMPVYVSGEAAVPEMLRNPESIVLYSAETPRELIRRGRWRRDEDSPNIFLRHQFWNPPEPEVPGSHRAPWLLVYGDLMASNDSRLRETAQEVRGRR